jgi:hypothetical protein
MKAQEDLRDEILEQLRIALEKLDARPELISLVGYKLPAELRDEVIELGGSSGFLAIIGLWGDLPDNNILTMLQDFNRTGSVSLAN